MKHSKTVDSVLAGDRPWALVRSDCLAALRRLPPESVDALVTDPPAGIEFMGARWDAPWREGFTGHGYPDNAQRTPSPTQRLSTPNPMCRSCRKHLRGVKGCRCATPMPDEDHEFSRRARLDRRDAFVGWLGAVMAEAYRVLKPGAHAVVWALPRTAHWSMLAIEDAGFEIRDVIPHLFGSGFPKSRNFTGRFAGWGTGLKPAAEHWILARKPLALPTVEANAARFGTGALHIDATRIDTATGDGCWGSSNATVAPARTFNGSPGMREYRSARHPRGRWPANLALSHVPGCADVCAEGCPVGLLDAQAGVRRSGLLRAGTRRNQSGGYRGGFPPRATEHDTYGDQGGASRFFAVFPPFYYCPKASRAERNAGVEDLAPGPLRWSSGTKSPGTFHAPGTQRAAPNHHPTVKPVALMRWLVRLITPPGGLVLDPFCGSGTTGMAAAYEGMRFVGVEQDPAYCRIARGRIAHAHRHLTAGGTCGVRTPRRPRRGKRKGGRG